MIDVVVVADAHLYRDMLAEVLDRQEGIRVVATTTGLDDAIAAVGARLPDVVLLAGRPPPDAFRRMLAADPHCRIVAMPEPGLVVAWAEHRTAPRIVRDATFGDVIAAVEAAAARLRPV
jgi:DNA-binding NarL/FixJ family response regulator